MNLLVLSEAPYNADSMPPDCELPAEGGTRTAAPEWLGVVGRCATSGLLLRYWQTPQQGNLADSERQRSQAA
jgi:hypothetical protein